MTRQICLQRPRPVVGRNVLDRSSRSRDAGIVDQYVDRTEAPFGLIEYSLDGVILADITLEHGDVRSRGSKLCHRATIYIAREDACPCIGEGFGDNAAGTTGAGRDNHDETADTGCRSDPDMAVGAHSVIHAER